MLKTYALIGLLASTAACGVGPPQSADAGVADARPTDAVPFTNGVGTLAGAGEAGATDGDRDVARFSNPVNLLVGVDGTLYVADFDNGSVRAVDRAGTVSTLISQPGFVRPFGLAQSATGVLYVETDNDPAGAHTPTSGTVWRVDAGTATVVAANLGRPRGLAVLADGRIATSDYAHHVIRLLDPDTGASTLLAGMLDVPGYVDAAGTAARFSQPYGIAERADGLLVVADHGNHRLRLVNVATGETTTLAGNGTPGFVDGALATAEFNKPQGIAIDSVGTLYISDADNYRVRRIQGTTVDTIAGNGQGGYLDDDDRLAAELYGLEGLSVSPDGAMVFVADGNRGEDVPYNRVRYIKMIP